MNTLVGLAMLLSITNQSPNQITLTWNSLSNVHYRILSNSRLRTNSWIRQTNLLGTGENMSFTLAPSLKEQYFKIEVRTNPLIGLNLYVDPNSQASNQIKLWAGSNPEGEFQIKKISSTPQSFWLNGRESNVRVTVSNILVKAAAIGRVASFVVYNIPFKNCGSAGLTEAAYLAWVRKIMEGLDGYTAIFIIEPDALAQLDCLSVDDQTVRLGLIRDAVNILREAPGAKVYLDSGHSFWHSASIMVARLKQAGITNAHGFVLNVSNYRSDAELIKFGTEISGLLGDMHFIIDSSRNGNGPTIDNEWCNAPGRALGRRPTFYTGHPLIDAYLWVKRPGESDDPCNGGPPAGVWWLDYALKIARNTPWI
jgi:endoglucanase